MGKIVTSGHSLFILHTDCSIGFCYLNLNMDLNISKIKNSISLLQLSALS